MKRGPESCIQYEFELETDQGSATVPLLPEKRESQTLTVGKAEFQVTSLPGENRRIELSVLSGRGTLFAAVKISISNWSLKNYLLLPAAVYGGNRIHIADRRGVYPPKLPPDCMNLDPPQLTGIIQHLEPDGGGTISHLSGEYAFPGMGFYCPERKKSCWFLTGQSCEAGDYGYTLTEAPGAAALELRICAPVHREFRASYNTSKPANDPPFAFQAGSVITFELFQAGQDCASLREFFRQSFLLRNRMVEAGKLPDIFPYSRAVKLLCGRLERENWKEEYGYYSTADVSMNAQFQIGWIGGGMKTEYLLLEGDPVQRAHARSELSVLFDRAQQPSGFFVTIARDGKFVPNTDPAAVSGSLVRKNADGFAVIARQLLRLRGRGENIPAAWIDGLRKLADAFSALWKKYGQFGYLLDPVTGKLTVGGGAGGVPAITGLAYASDLFQEPEYLRTAEECIPYYISNYLQKGNVYGGVGDALQATDSESAYSLLEAVMTVWEYTGRADLLETACFAADYVATWCVAYDYRFPPESTFGKMQMASAGTVYANIQNRHSAPGFCSAGGDSLFKLYRATGKKEYGCLIRDIVHSLPQFMSRRDRPIFNLDPDRINERVNLADWEGKDHIGEVYNGTSWPEVCVMLARIQMSGVYLNTDTGDLLRFDHVRAEWNGRELLLSNPTAFDAEITVLAENSAEAARPLKLSAFEKFQRIQVPGRGQRSVSISS